LRTGSSVEITSPQIVYLTLSLQKFHFHCKIFVFTLKFPFKFSEFTLIKSKVNMKGTVVKCLEEMVCSKFGKDKWQISLEKAGVKKNTLFLPTSNIDDSQVIEIVGAVCSTLNITLVQAADAFGDYWINVYCQKMYRPYFRRYKTTQDFLLALNEIHVEITEVMDNAKPPKFTYQWQNDKTLIMHYKSHRGLIDFAMGSVKGIAKYYGENLNITKISSDKLKIIFP